MEKTLELQFENEYGKVVTISLNNPVEPIDPALVSESMDIIIAENAFTSSGGNLVKKRAARIVTRTVEEIKLV